MLVETTHVTEYEYYIGHVKAYGHGLRSADLRPAVALATADCVMRSTTWDMVHRSTCIHRKPMHKTGLSVSRITPKVVDEL